jgi:hypothetical protein
MSRFSICWAGSKGLVVDLVESKRRTPFGVRLAEKLEVEPRLHFDGAGAESAVRLAEVRIGDSSINVV